ncbi:FecR family protein [Bacteroides fragilis]|nr:FecR family protein [Bacteroides fragilis]
MDKNSKEIDLIKKLLSDRLDKKGRKKLYHSNLIKKQMRKQWNENKNNPVDTEIGNQIWNKIENRCKKVHKRIVPLELWYIAASVALVLIVGGLWMYSNTGRTQIEKYIEFTAQESRMYLLPDSSKVWMQPGSSIRFAENFKECRDVWLKGNSLFEVRKNSGSKFRVYIDKAFIEVKGTCFLIKQNNPNANEITLFNGSIEFNIESTHDKIAMKPLQELVYNPVSARTQLRRIENIEWQNGRYNFTQFNLEHLTRIMNQMYGSHITISDKVNKNCAFTGSIRYDESLEDVIDKICFSLNLRSKEMNEGILIYN